MTRFLLRYWWLSPPVAGLFVILRILCTLIDVFVPLATGWLLDAIVRTTDRQMLDDVWQAFVLSFFLLIAFVACRNILTLLTNRISSAAMAKLAMQSFVNVQRFSSDWHASSFSGTTVRKITRGMWAFNAVTETLAFGILPAILVSVGITGVFTYNWPMLGGLVFFGIAMFMTISILLAVRWVAPANNTAQEIDAKISGHISDAISAILVVKSFAAEDREEKHLEGLVSDWRLKTMVAWDRNAYTGLVQASLLVSLQVGLLSAGILLWRIGSASAGDIVMIVATQALFTGYLRDIGLHVRNLQKALGDLRDIVEIERTVPSVVDPEGARALLVSRGHIQFERVTFRYAGASPALYREFSCEIRAGEKVGLVGPSGAGKSTFVKLLQRLYDVEAGRILIDGQDISLATQQSLRSVIGHVPQDAVLFHRSLRENIAYGRPDAPASDIHEAARYARADLFIEKLDAGYDTIVGERGIKLSGGERQRVAIARAILADTPILVFDEATSSLDSVSEQHIREAIEIVAKGRTTIIIAHRLSTVKALDRILVFDKGAIVESGTHESLSRIPDGHYRRLLAGQDNMSGAT